MRTETPEATKVAKCQYCKAEIAWDAQKCRHCGEWVGTPPDQRAGRVRATMLRPLAGDKPNPGALGWIATATLAVGVFLPFLTIPFLGGLSYWEFGSRGAVVLALAAFAMTAFWQQWRVIMLATTFPALGVVGFDFVRVLLELETAMGGIVSLGFGAFVLLVASVAAVLAAWRLD